MSAPNILSVVPDEGREKHLSDLRDPFRSDCVEVIRFRISKAWFTKKVEFTACVEFTNGPTRGEQNFTAPDFPTLVRMVDDFTASLKK